MKIIIAFSLIVTGIGSSLVAGEAHAAKECGLDQIISSYQNGLKNSKAGKHSLAASSMQSLASAGFGPAQMRLAELYQRGSGVEKSPAQAAFWATLAMRAGDKEAAAKAPQMMSEINAGGGKKMEARVAAWKAVRLDCKVGALQVTENRQPIEIDNLALTARGRNPGQLLAQAKPQFAKIIGHAQSTVPGAELFLRVIDGVEFYGAERYHRFLDWKRDGKKNILRFAVSNFRDQKPDFLAQALVTAAKRRAYSKLKNTEFEDPLIRWNGKIRLVGAIYPDIKNEQFFKTINKALEMGARLPPELRRYINIVDEMRYNPPSKHFIRGGTLDASAGYYNKFLSSKENRIIFFRRKVLFSSPIFFLRTIIHEGTHAAQDEQADAYRHEIPRDDRKLKQLVSAGRGDSQEALKLKQVLKAKNHYLERWYRGVKKPQGWIQDIRFECEATINEIKALQALGGAPDMMRDSGYVRVCPDAQRMLVRWRDQRFKNRRRQ